MINIYHELERILAVPHPPLKDHHRLESLWITLEKRRDTVIFGAGPTGATLKTSLESRAITVSLFLDNNPSLHGTTQHGVPVYHPDTISDEQLKTWPILTASNHAASIARQLTKRGLHSARDFFVCYPFWFEVNVMGHGYGKEFEEYLSHAWSKLRRVAELIDDPQARFQFFRYLHLRLYYLSPEYIAFELFFYPRTVPGLSQLTALLDDAASSHLAHWLGLDQQSPREPFVRVQSGDNVVDGGAWVGDTTWYFALKNHPHGKVWAFEPNAQHCSTMQRVAQAMGWTERIIVEPCGLSAASGTNRWMTSPDWHGSGSYIDANGDRDVDVKSLDDYFLNSGARIDVIKLDIEGSELAALQGAEQLIRRDTPRLWVCVYHTPTHLHEIPLFIHRVRPDYRITFRHSGNNPMDAYVFAE